MANKLMLDHKSLNLEGSYTVKTDIWGNYTIRVANITSGYHQLYHPDTSVRYGAILYGTGEDKSIGVPIGYNTIYTGFTQRKHLSRTDIEAAAKLFIVTYIPSSSTTTNMTTVALSGSIKKTFLTKAYGDKK
ncbi:hypothetical protein CHS0354_015036 [Potamilus streckersoni]|uniref:Uncharacterized protein n=1 Tax=Potamilus streckersoni TaxID=2493646 RepID=A0AAE0TH90_9BIVA|nr:hypothetical protein CHS0354_015036 [Potamilus streckersoni]